MARDGEIQNVGLLQRMADFLNIGGVRRYPLFLNTDIVQPVLSIPFDDSLNYLGAYPVSLPTDVSGLPNAPFQISGVGAAPLGALLDCSKYIVELVALYFNFAYSAAAATAMAGTGGVSVQIALQVPPAMNTIPVAFFEKWHIPIAATADSKTFVYGPYNWTSGSENQVQNNYRPIVAAPGFPMSANVSRYGGAVFPGALASGTVFCTFGAILKIKLSPQGTPNTLPS